MTELSAAVAVIDLHTANVRDLSSRRISDLLAGHARGGSGQRTLPSRVILLDRARDLVAHADIVDLVLGAPVDLTLLCVVTGDLDADGMLHRPELLARHEKAATVWLGDRGGVGWGMQSGIASAVYAGADTSPYPVPPALLDVLGWAPVFDAVVAAVRRLPASAAAPGLRAVRAEVSAQRLERAREAAFAALTANEGTWNREPVRVQEKPEASGRFAAARAVIPGGWTDRRLQSAQQRLAEARAVLDTGRGGIGAALTALSEALRAVAQDAYDAIEACDSLTVDDPEYRAALSRLGLEVAAADQSAENPNLDLLVEAGLGFLAEHGALPVLADRLSNTADRYGAPIKEVYHERLRKTGIEDQCARLDAFRDDVAAAPTSPAVGLTGLGALLATLAAGSAGGGAGLALVGTALALYGFRSRLTRLGLGAATRLAAIRLGAASFGGVVLGGLVSLLDGRTTWSGAVWLGIGAAGTTVLGALAVAGWNRMLGRRLRAQLRAGEVGESLDRVKALIEEVVRDERRKGERHYEICDLARVLRTVLLDLTEAFRDYRPPAGLPDDPGSPAEQAGIDLAASRQLTEQLSEIDAVVLGDLGDVAAGVFEHFVETSRVNRRISMPEPGAVKTEADSRLDAYFTAVAESGVHGRPRDCRDPEGRDRLTAQLWGQAGRLPEFFWCEATDPRITQFCAPEDLGLLEIEPGTARMVRFAPRAAAHLTGGERRTERSSSTLVLTEESRLLGVLRLVPLRIGVVSDDLHTDGSAPSLGRPDWIPQGALTPPPEPEPPQPPSLAAAWLLDEDEEA